MYWQFLATIFVTKKSSIDWSNPGFYAHFKDLLLLKVRLIVDRKTVRKLTTVKNYEKNIKKVRK